MFQYLEFFLQAVHLSPQGVNDVLSVFQHKALQLLGGLHLLNFLQRQESAHRALSVKKYVSHLDADWKQLQPRIHKEITTVSAKVGTGEISVLVFFNVVIGSKWAGLDWRKLM